MRGLLISIGVIIAVVVGFFVYAFSSLDTLIKDAVEKYGSEITQASVTLDKVDLNPGEGKAGLSGLKVSNPKGFETPHAFKLGEISVNIDIDSITSAGPGDPVIIKEVLIGAPEVTYELNSNGSNIDAIQKNVNSYIAKLGLSSQTPAKKEKNGGIKLIIENLIVRQGTVNISASILKGESLSAPLPDIHIKDIGKEKGGATPGEVAEKLLTTLNKNVSKAVAGIGIGKTLDSLKNHLASATDVITKGAGAVGGKLKGLLGN